MRSFRSAALVLSCAAAWLACADDATDGVPTQRPDGDATGTAATGDYSLESLTTACSGTCAVSVSGFTVSVCDVGDRVPASATVTQSDGHLQIDSADSDYISRLAGGISADGSFDVSGVKTEGGNSVTIATHVVGKLTQPTADAAIDGTATLQVTGSYEGHPVNCRITAEVEGHRLPVRDDAP